MLIDYNILITYGGVAKRLDKDEFIFMEGEQPHFYYQLIEGNVKMFSTNTSGREFIQGIFSKGQSFGEPPLFIGKAYPSTAITLTPCVVVKITKEKLFHLLDDYPEITKSLLDFFAQRIYSKSVISQIRSCATPEEKISLFLESNISTYSNKKSLVPYTRQQIADFTGLRVETVIRTLIKMDKEKKVEIIHHKLYF